MYGDDPDLDSLTKHPKDNRDATIRTPLCYRCQHKGHWISDCTVPTSDLKCDTGKSGHTSVGIDPDFQV